MSVSSSRLCPRAQAPESVPASEVQSELDRMYASVGREAKIRGFRQGRVPRAVLERMFGDQVHREVLTRLVEHSLHHAIEAEHLDVIGSPEIDVDALTPGESFKYAAIVDIRPTIDVGDTSGIEVTRPVLEVDDADVARALDSMRENVAQLKPIEDRFVIEAGDVVALNVATHLEGGEPQKREGALVEAGGSFPQALENQLVGQTKGASTTIEVPYPPTTGTRRSPARPCASTSRSSIEARSCAARRRLRP